MGKYILLCLLLASISLFSQNNISVSDTIKYHEDNNYYSIEFSYVNFFDGKKEIKELNESINNYFNSYKKEFSEALDEDIKAEMDSGFITGRYTTIVNTQYFILENGIISVFLEVYYYTLGAHGNINFSSFHYDTKTNKFIGIGDIANIKDQEGLDKFNDLLKTHFINTDNCFDITPNIEAMNYNMFYLDNENITIVFPPYALGSYACGVAEVKIPFSDLKK